MNLLLIATAWIKLSPELSCAFCLPQRVSPCSDGNPREGSEDFCSQVQKGIKPFWQDSQPQHQMIRPSSHYWSWPLLMPHQIKCDRVCHHGPVRLWNCRTGAQPLRKQYVLNSGFLKAYCFLPRASLQHSLLGSSVTIHHVHSYTHADTHTQFPRLHRKQSRHTCQWVPCWRGFNAHFLKSKQHPKLAKAVKTNSKNWGNWQNKYI